MSRLEERATWRDGDVELVGVDEAAARAAEREAWAPPAPEPAEWSAPARAPSGEVVVRKGDWGR